MPSECDTMPAGVPVGAGDSELGVGREAPRDVGIHVCAVGQPGCRTRAIPA